MNRTLILTGVLAGLALALALGLLRKVHHAPSGQPAAKTEDASSQGHENRSALPSETAKPKAGRPQSGQQTPPGLYSNLPADLLTAIGQGPQRDLRTRLQAVAKLGRNLSEPERQALYEYLGGTAEEKALRLGQTFALKNEILNVLRDQQSPPVELTGVLAGLWRDPAQPLVMRDYALQHLAPWFSKAPLEQRDQIVRTLDTAASESRESWAGTALLGLRRIQEENPGTAVPAFGDRVGSIVQDSSANPLARITAVQLAGELRLRQAEGPLCRMALDESLPTTLRIAATGALGHWGGPGAAAVLAQAANANNPRLNSAARCALAMQRQPAP